MQVTFLKDQLKIIIVFKVKKTYNTYLCSASKEMWSYRFFEKQTTNIKGSTHTHLLKENAHCSPTSLFLYFRGMCFDSLFLPLVPAFRPVTEQERFVPVLSWDAITKCQRLGSLSNRLFSASLWNDYQIIIVCI